MNKIILIISSIFVISCGSDVLTENVTAENEALKKEIAELSVSNQEYKEGLGLFESDIEQYRSVLAEIEKNIAAVDTKHQMLINLKGDVKGDKEVGEDIVAHIDHIHEIMLNNKHKINHLHNSLNNATAEEGMHKDSIQVLDQTFYDLATAVYVQDKVIKGMHALIVDDSQMIKELEGKYESQKMETEVLHYIINTKFYVIGTKEELLDQGVITAEGGVVGLGRQYRLNAEANVTLFTPLNAVEEYIIKFEAKNAKVLTIHPEENYLFLGEEDNTITGIEINDYKAFWDKSDFLVIEIKK